MRFAKPSRLAAAACALAAASLALVPAAPAVASGEVDLLDAYTDFGRYQPGQKVTVTAKLTAHTAWSGPVTFTLTHLGVQVATGTVQTQVQAGEEKTITWDVTPPAKDFSGYLVEVKAPGDATATALDVSSDWTHFPRMGYLHDYGADVSDQERGNVVTELTRKYHLNALQFYDWMWRHEKPVERNADGSLVDSWTAWNGDVIAPSTVKSYIDDAHDKNVAALPYSMSYAALEGFQEHGVSPDWRLQYADSGSDWKFQMIQNRPETNLWIMNPANPGWQDHITAEYVDQVKTMGFDGTHLDQLGNWGKNAPGGEVDGGMQDINGQRVNLPNAFADLVGKTKKALKKTDGKVVGFNAVDGFGGDALAASESDYLYSELWENHESYAQVKAYLNGQRELSGGKPAIIAAYENYNSNTGDRYEAENAALAGGTNTNNNHPGYTGTGFVDAFGQPGDSVTFTVNATESRRYGLVPAYTNGTPTTATRTVTVDGVVLGKFRMQSTNGWDDYKHDASLFTHLDAGQHTVKISVENDDAGYINLDSLTLGTFDTPSVQLANAAIAANGATQIEMGQDNQKLAAPYFLDHSKQMSVELEEWMNTYYDVITAYENVLYGPDLKQVDPQTNPVTITGKPTSNDGTANAIWTNVMRNGNTDVIHLINLLGNSGTWREGPKSTIPTQANLPVKYYIGANADPSSVKIASPDHNQGASETLPFVIGTDAGGRYVSFTVPQLDAWSFVYLEQNGKPGKDKPTKPHAGASLEPYRPEELLQ
ncbi:glycoside hydrolase family 66 protein [Arthrobacter sp. CJ23]|uniref:glycoside hydrolase family 66 protein n=1 Tax=Arthrobacter sp. CJ23 TaxID=2972479 RepID=UPI00215D49C2|nr:glycoside hydrolase family 66 protein [Arthrobacter sp. CJ23]UVJ38634.1 carbohydrate-binding protein [Arthrobacter sp. CJ23]